MSIKSVQNYENGKVYKVEWKDKNGRLHKPPDDNGVEHPALEVYDETGRILQRTWYINGYYTRSKEDLPYEICYNYDMLEGFSRVEIKRYHLSIITKSYFKKCREVEYLSIIEYRKNSSLHRYNNLPAVIEYFPSGNVKSEKWYTEDKLHSPLINGKEQPAVKKYLEYHRDNNMVESVWDQAEFWEYGGYKWGGYVSSSKHQNSEEVATEVNSVEAKSVEEKCEEPPKKLEICEEVTNQCNKKNMKDLLPFFSNVECYILGYTCKFSDS